MTSPPDVSLVVSSFEIVLVHSQCSPCLRGDKSPEKPFHHGATENTENPVEREIRTLPSRLRIRNIEEVLAGNGRHSK